ncbi:sensor histidine kinase [Spirosoma lituiforme]
MSRLRVRTLPEWTIHAVIWVLFVIKDVSGMYYNPTYPVPKTAVATYWLLVIGYTSISAGAFYGSVGLIARPLLNRTLTWRHYGFATGGLLVTLAGITAWRYVLEMLVFKPLLGFDNYSRSKSFTLVWFVRNSVLYYADFITYGLLYSFIKRHFINERQRREIEQTRTTAELAFLRSQLNPHFLFNTINDIYALVYCKSDDAPGALLKLSELLRYVLHDARHDRVLLAKELAYLHSLIELQRISTKENLHVDYQLRGQLDGQLIAPLLLVSFVENAFKHGVVSDALHPIKLHLDLTEATLSFQLSNRKNQQQKDHTGGIGLANVQRRLNLLYPGHHRLHVDDQETEYRVILHLDL